MDGRSGDRRKFPRATVREHGVCLLTNRDVRVADVSLGGVLLTALAPLPIMTGTLRVPLAEGEICVDIHVRHERRLPDGSVQLGAAFLRPDGTDGKRLLRSLGALGFIKL